jgi:transposase-like protein
MPRKRHKAEEIVAKLRQVEVLSAQGQSVAEAIRSIGVTEVTYYRWRSEYGGLKGDQQGIKRGRSGRGGGGRKGARTKSHFTIRSFINVNQ